MKTSRMKGALFSAAISAAILLTFSVNTSQAAQDVPDWPGLYNPFTLLTLNLEMGGVRVKGQSKPSRRSLVYDRSWPTVAIGYDPS